MNQHDIVHQRNSVEKSVQVKPRSLRYRRFIKNRKHPVFQVQVHADNKLIRTNARIERNDIPLGRESADYPGDSLRPRFRISFAFLSSFLLRTLGDCSATRCDYVLHGRYIQRGEQRCTSDFCERVRARAAENAISEMVFLEMAYISTRCRGNFLSTTSRFFSRSQPHAQTPTNAAFLRFFPFFLVRFARRRKAHTR